MNESEEIKPGRGSSSAQLDARLAEIERRLQQLTDMPGAPGDRHETVVREVEALREAMDDLAADVVGLHDQMSVLVSMCERIVAGARGGDRGLTVDRLGGRRRSVSAIPRVAARFVRNGVGAARRMLRSTDGESVARLDLGVDLEGKHSSGLPRLTIVIPVGDDSPTNEVPLGLADQTDPALEVVFWNQGRGAAIVRRPGHPPVELTVEDRQTLADALDSEYVALVPMSIVLMSTTIELCRWTLASEQLPLVLAVPEGVGGRRRFFEVLPRSRWRDLESVDRRNRSAVVAKVVGAVEDGAAVDMPLEFNGKVCARVERYLVSPTETGRIRHLVRPVGGLAMAPESDDDRPAVLVLASFADGVDNLLLWLINELEAEYDVTVLITGTGDVNAAAPLRALAARECRTFPISGFIDPEVWPSLVAGQIAATGARTVVRIGGQPDVPAGARSDVRIIDVLLGPAEAAAAADADRVIGLGRDGAEAARAAGLATIEVGLAPPLPELPPAENWVAAVLQALGVADGERLVVMGGNLTPAQRPEDFVAIAHRLRDREDLQFRLVGEGPLGGTVCDLARYFSLERFALVPPSYSAINLAAAAEIVVSTAERNPWPLMPAYGLACGRALVATDVDGVRELVDDAGGDRCTLVSVGDLSRFAAAIADAADSKRRPQFTKKAWNAGAKRAAAARTAFMAALDDAIEDRTESV